MTNHQYYRHNIGSFFFLTEMVEHNIDSSTQNTKRMDQWLGKPLEVAL